MFFRRKAKEENNSVDNRMRDGQKQPELRSSQVHESSKAVTKKISSNNKLSAIVAQTDALEKSLSSINNHRDSLGIIYKHADEYRATFKDSTWDLLQDLISDSLYMTKIC